MEKRSVGKLEVSPIGMGCMGFSHGCLAHNIGVVPFSPVASGFLSGAITTKTAFEKKDDVRNFVPQFSKENLEGNRPILDI